MARGQGGRGEGWRGNGRARGGGRGERAVQVPIPLASPADFEAAFAEAFRAAGPTLLELRAEVLPPWEF